MNIRVSIDENQTDSSDRSRMAFCPACGQKLVEVRSIFHHGVFRLKCRRCKRYLLARIFDSGS